MQIILANPRGFCAGVDRAIEIVNRALELFGPPIYVRHEVVHNKFVVSDLRQRGAIFVDELEDIPDDAIVIFSAHGVSQNVRDEAKNRGFQVFDATCPLVTKVHMEVVRFSNEGRDCILIGHAGHPEVEGTMGQYRSQQGKIYLVEHEADARKLEVMQPNHLAFVTQTTLSVDDTQKIIDILQERFPKILAPHREDICYATQNRQDAVKELAHECDAILVVGSPNSSNSNRLRELAERCGIPAYLLDAPEEIQPEWLHNIETLGVTAGASAPELLVQNVVKRVQNLVEKGEVRELYTRTEDVVFSLPKALRAVSDRNDRIPVIES
ncbi:MAG: 4-hydroxy-3-methylbut-2-enyl diphosphate reductase [Pseudomonadota bacterium]